MQRDLARLGNESFDIVVVGAGIYGAAVAWDAAQRGLSVALIDRGDFGGATSFNSLKTVHGGLRSLQHLAVHEVREFVRERRALTRIAPHLVHPLPFLVPTYRHPTRSRIVMRAVLALNDLIAHDRNTLPDPSKHLPRGRIISREECLRLHPGIDPRGVTGGAVWYDCQMHSPDRVTLSFVLSAGRAGAAVANYVEARSFLADGSRVAGVRARDLAGDRELDIRARIVVNAAGPWVPEVLQRVPGRRPRFRLPGLSKALNVVTGPVGGSHALGGLAGSRFLFLVPWRDCSIIGTSHDPFADGPDGLRVTRPDVERFLAEARRAFPRLDLSVSDVRLVHRGLLPSFPAGSSGVRLLKHSQVYDHAAEGIAGLLSVLGVRFTTARATAQIATDRLFTMLGRTPPPCRTAVTPLEGGDIDDFAAYERQAVGEAPAGVPAETIRRLVRCYGSQHGSIVQALAGAPDLAEPLGVSCFVTRAELRHAIRHEMALTLADAVLRRTDAGSSGHPGADAVKRAALDMARELGWSGAQVQREIAELERVYAIDE